MNNLRTLVEVAELLKGSREFLESLENGTKIIEEGEGFGSLENDVEIHADQALGSFVKRELINIKDSLKIGRITVEGKKDDFVFPDGENWWTIDPLDGSLNYLTKGLTQGLPFSMAITVLEKIENATFNDVIASGVIDFRNGDLWTSAKEDHVRAFSCINTQNCQPCRAEKLDLGKMIVVGEFYYPENREKLVKAFSGQKGWLRNPGSAAYEMALVASGQVAAFICDRQKQHELGAAYRLVKEAGGVVVDFDGKDIGSRAFLFNFQTPVILAGNQNLAAQILELLHK